MPNLTKDPSPPRPQDVAEEPNLYLAPSTGKYYAKRYVPALGKEKVVCLEETNRYRAILKKNQVVAQWLGSRAIRGDVYIDGLIAEILQHLKDDVAAGIKSEKTFLDFEGHVRLHILEPVQGSYAGLRLSEATTHWPKYKALQRQLTPWRKVDHDRKHLKTIFKYAYDLRLIDRMPEMRLDSFDTRVQKAEEFTDAEYAAIQEHANPKLALKIETMMLTQLRSNSVRLLEWEWFNWETGAIRIPGPAMKMKDDHIVVLDKPLLAKYRAEYERQCAPPIYCYPHRDDKTKPESRTDKGWQRLRKKLEIKKKRHWLRASGVRRAIRGGQQQVTVQGNARMADKTMKQHYYDPSEDDKRRVSETVRASLKEAPNG